MKIKSLLFLGYLVFWNLMFSCTKNEDSQEITHTLNAGFSFSGIENWPERYSITLGVFNNDTVNPTVFQIISKPVEMDLVTIKLDHVPNQSSILKLYVSNLAHQPVFTLFRKKTDTSGNMEITYPRENIKLLSFQRIQAQVFSNCIVCHGGSSGEPAAGLNLMPKESYGNLVNKAAINSAKIRVQPGDIENSFLIDVLRKKQNLIVHTASNTIPMEDIELIEQWIKSDAPND